MSRRLPFAAGLALAGALALAGPATAQNGTGRVVGRVVDADTGEPLVGGVVMVESTGLGNVARGDGSYFIDGVPAGVQRFRSEYLGYAPTTQERRVSGGGTTTIDFRLSPSAIQSNPIVAVVERPPIPPPRFEPPPVEVHALRPQEPPPHTETVRCTTRVATHGAYIRDGRWEMLRTVGELRCGDPPPLPCETPVATTGTVVVEGG